MSHVAAFYDKIAKIYPVLDIFLQEPKKQLLMRVNQEEPGRLLEIGVGRGDNLPVYKHRPVTGIDVSEGMLAYARKKAPSDCSLQIMDASRLEFPDNSFDYSVISHVLTVVPDPAAVMNEVYRVVRPRGKVFILNHESTGPVREKINKVLTPLSSFLHFSSLFDMGALVNPLHFSVLHKARHGFMPSITLMILQKNETPAQETDH